MNTALRRSRAGGIATSCVVHGIVIAAAFVLTAQRRPARVDSVHATHALPSDLIWVEAAGPFGGGGSGGDDQQSPARAAEVKGSDALTMPAAPRAALEVSENPEPPVERLPEVPVQTMGASTLTMLGLVEAGAETLSRGPGEGTGVGNHGGSGAGPGDGSGLGDGDGGNTGGEVYGPGNGVTMPRVVHEEKPRYTMEAMRARIEGAVILQCVVQPSGVCARLRVLRSLDSRLGLDEQALQAAAAWRFSPGTRLGKPVAVLVTIQLGFAIH